MREILREFGLTAHIRSRGEEARTIKRETGFKARCWVVERAHLWMNHFHRLLVRWDKKPENYLAFRLRPDRFSRCRVIRIGT